MRAACLRAAVAGWLLCGVAGCAKPPPDPVWDARPLDTLHAQSQLQARAMVGKEYIITAPLRVCRDEADVSDRLDYGRPRVAQCRMFTSGRFRVEDVIVRRDGRTMLRIAGPQVNGFLPYEIYLPQGYTPVETYFPTGR